MTSVQQILRNISTDDLIIEISRREHVEWLKTQVELIRGKIDVNQNRLNKLQVEIENEGYKSFSEDDKKRAIDNYKEKMRGY